MLTTEEIVDIAKQEGLAYTIYEVISPEEIEDNELSELWKKAQIIIEKINQKLKEYEY